MAFYVICDDDSKHESMTKEQILAAITQAIETGNIGNIDTGFVTKLKEQNNGSAVTIWVGTQAQYNAIENKAQNCLYIITDDTTGADIEKMFDEVKKMAINVDFTDRVTISRPELGEEESADWYETFTPERFEYNPCTGIVHFVVNMSIYGSVEKGEELRFNVTGNGYPPRDGNAYPICIGGDLFSSGYYEGESIVLRVRESADTDAGMNLSGWYFAKTVN
jgi:hypothetical protein